MSMVDRLLEQLKNRDISVVYVSDTELKLTGNTKAADPKLIEAVKAFKPDLLERLRPRDFTQKRYDVHHAPVPVETVPADGPETCVECNAWVHPENGQAEDIARLCHHTRCPFKGKRRG